MRIAPKALLILVASVTAALSLSALRPAPQMTVQNQDWTEYYSTNGRVLTVEYIRPADPNLQAVWHTAYEIPASNNYSFEVTDIQAFNQQKVPDYSVEENTFPWTVRIARANGSYTPVARGETQNRWRRTGVIMQPGDKLEVRSFWDGVYRASIVDYYWIINGNVTR